MSKNHYIAAGIIIIIVGCGAFFGGMQYGENKTKKSQSGIGDNFTGEIRSGQRGIQQGGQNFQRVGGANTGGFINGDIFSKDGTSITVKSQDGNSKIIFFSDSTTIGKTVDGSASDLSIGQQVIVNGKVNTDGTIAAQNIQIRPIKP